MHIDTDESSGVGFIGINMHSERKLRADANDNIIKNQRTTVGVNFDLDNLFIGNTQILSVLRSGMNMTFCRDNAFAQLHFTAGAYQFTRCAARNVTGFSHWSGNA